MRSGCLGLFVRIGAVSAAAILAAVSVALIVSFAVSALGQPSGASTVIGIAIASIAGFCFFLVGRSIWRELTEKPREPEDRRREGSDGR